MRVLRGAELRVHSASSVPVSVPTSIVSAVVDFLDSEIGEVDQLIAAEALSWPQVKRLMTVPGVNVIVAATFMAAVGDIRRFWLLEGASRAADPKAQVCALTRRRPRRTELSHHRRSPINRI
jgi:transposase